MKRSLITSAITILFLICMPMHAGFMSGLAKKFGWKQPASRQIFRGVLPQLPRSNMCIKNGNNCFMKMSQYLSGSNNRTINSTAMQLKFFGIIFSKFYNSPRQK